MNTSYHSRDSNEVSSKKGQCLDYISHNIFLFKLEWLAKQVEIDIWLTKSILMECEFELECDDFAQQLSP